MCGIHGLVESGATVESLRAKVSHMAGRQRHRGPDAVDARIFPFGDRQVALGFVRLSILDLETGMQPIEDTTRGLAIACNGQVYNYRTLRARLGGRAYRTTGDMEVALRAYEHHGLDFVQHLNGMYAGAIVDRARWRLVLFNDRFGIKSIYYRQWAGRFAFASEISALQAVFDEPPALDRVALADYLALGYATGSRTLHAGIQRLPPASCLVLDLRSGAVETRCYWRYVPRPDPTLTLESAGDEAVDLLTDSVALRQHADVPVAALLSGGLDSAAVTALARRADPDLALYTIGHDDPSFDERPAVRKFLHQSRGEGGPAALIEFGGGDGSLDALPAIVRHLEEPLAMSAVLPTWALFEGIGGRHKVVLTGEGADELFAGYGWFRSAGGEGGPGERPMARYLASRQFFDRQEIGRLLGEATPLREPECPPIEAAGAPLEILLQAELACRLPRCNLLRLDKLAMAHSIEARTPFLDYRLAEFAARLPADLKLGPPSRRGRGFDVPPGKHVLREGFRRRGLLPSTCTAAPKQPFCAPIDRLLADPNRPAWLTAFFAGQHPLFEDQLAGEVALALLDGFERAVHTPFTNVTAADRAWSLVMLAAWYEHHFLASWP